MAEAYINQHLWKYKNKDLTKKALLSTTRAFTDLHVKEDTFAFPVSLLSLNGTIPVFFKGSRYNIPVSIRLLENFPGSPPMCYVKPTENMLIKVSRHVDITGKVYLPYLKEWKHPTSDLVGLIQVMMVVFGENSPVYARPAFPSQDPFKPIEILSMRRFLKSQEYLNSLSTCGPKVTANANQQILKPQKSTQSLNSVFGVSKKSLMDYREMFNHFDKEKRGKLDHRNLKSCLRALGYDLPMVEEGQQEPVFEAILDAVDPNRGGFVSLQTYMFFMVSQETDSVPSQDEIEKAFQGLADEGKPLTKQGLDPLIVKSDSPEDDSTNLKGNVGAKSPVLPGDDYSTQIKTMEEELKREKEAWKEERKQMEKRIEELDGEVKNLQEQLEQMRNHSKRLEEESQEMKQNYESKTADLEAELRQTKHDKTSSQTEVKRLQKELEARKQPQVENGPGKGTMLGNSEDTSPLSTKETGSISLEDFGKFLYHLSSHLTQEIIRELTLVLAFSPTESEQAEKDNFKCIRLLREKGLISQADITPLTKALVTIGRHGVCDTVKKLWQSNPSKE